ncbi:MAG: 2-oxoglutarate dehydrogenase complex dihydrolipoyllysine-residue succinyltransferase [Gammaproteobacteria bacterium]|nr:2-oxoglutarate dehydrogenase complex dihydrolipoyllysine-residue succinyltransferase [Gammaproteobacteria bacterium]
MTVEIKVPVFPESVTDGTIVAWHKKKGDAVHREEVIADIETDKVVFEVPAPEDGIIDEIVEGEGTVVVSEQIIARLDTSAYAKASAEKKSETPSPPVSTPPAAKVPADVDEKLVMPAARKMAAEKGIDTSKVSGSGKGGRVLKEDLMPTTASSAAPVAQVGAREEKRVPMTRLRARIAERLVEAQQTAAILTTFNEVNMQPVTEMRAKYKDIFEKKHGVRLGFMSFFVKAAVEALKRFPEINASVDGNDIVYHGFFDIGIAVGSPRGLVVPILRDADQLSIAEIESRIRDFGTRAKEGKLGMEDITGGTFSITNGGVFGSLMSTPILNPPQSAILGMHKVQDRPMAENGQVVIRPMMYLALSYDHRIVDGREAVQFLVTIKELVEDPGRILLEI